MEKTRRNYRTQTYIDGNTVRKLEAAPDYRREQEEKQREEIRQRNRRMAQKNQEKSAHIGIWVMWHFIRIAAGYVCGSSAVYPSAVWNYNAFKDNFCIRKPGS